MNIHKSAEDYLEMVLMLLRKNDRVRSIDIAKTMNFSRASVSRAMKNLKLDGYIDVDGGGYIHLTQKGMLIADNMLKRHTILTDFFTRIGVDSKTAEQDACKIEHDLSDITFDALERYITK